MRVLNSFVDGFLLPFEKIWKFFGALDRLGRKGADWIMPE